MSAAEAGASVVVVERAPEKKRGGNGPFTGGFLRCSFDGIEDLRQLVDLSPLEEKKLEVDRFTPEEFFLDVAEVSDYRADPDLVDVLVNNSLDTVKWLRGLGVPFVPAYGLHGTGADGKVRMSGVAPIVEVSGGGAGLLEVLFRKTVDMGIPILYATRATGLVTDSRGRLAGVTVERERVTHTIEASNVVLAAGGFEASPEMRARYLGPGWDLARVRGSSYNTGDGIRMALAVGAQAVGNWTGCHAAPLDVNAPPFGDPNLSDAFVRRSFHLGITVNRNGERFADEGADVEFKTYSEMGKLILAQSGQVAFQLFDATMMELVRSEYTLRQATRYDAESFSELANKAGIDGRRLERTIDEFNAAATGTIVDPRTKDGISAATVYPPKSNWAAPLNVPPYTAFPVTGGITFTYGGIRINSRSQVMHEDGHPIDGLYAAGEMVGGLFYGNYPLGCGVMAGAVFGRMAGKTAASSTVGTANV